MNIFNFLKERIPIADIIGEYLALKNAGAYLKAHCPFHQEQTASFTVSPHRGIFYCFGCHVTGDGIAFVAKMEQCSQIHAAQFLADRYQIEIPSNVRAELHAKEGGEREQHNKTCEFIMQWCHQMLMKQSSPLSYLAKRGIDKQSIVHFSLGYFPAGAANIKQCEQAARSAHLLPKDLIDCGFLFEGKESLYSPFEDRIIFPIKDAFGNVCGFGGRVYKTDDTRPKYYNSQESSFFLKGSILYGLHAAKKSIQKEANVYVVEGYLDCIAMAQQGYTNTVATMGTACSVRHLQELAHHTPRITIMYDGDKAGVQAVMRIASLCWQAGADLFVVPLPAGQDPATLLLEHKTTAPGIVAQAQDIFSFFIATAHKDPKNFSLQEKMSHAHEILEIIATVKDPIKQDLLLQQLSRVSAISLPALRKAFSGPAKSKFLPAPLSWPIKSLAKPQNPSKSPGKIEVYEQRLVYAFISNPRLFCKPLDTLLTPFILEYVSEEPRQVLMNLAKMLSQTKDRGIDITHFFGFLPEQEQKYVGALIVSHEDAVSMSELADIFLQLYRHRWGFIIAKTKEMLAKARQEEKREEISRLLSDFEKSKQASIISSFQHVASGDVLYNIKKALELLSSSQEGKEKNGQGN